MSLSWKTRNASLWLATAVVGASACFGVIEITNWLRSDDDSSNERLPIKVAAKPKQQSGIVSAPTEAQVAQASSINLQRMNPPKLPPPPEKTVIAEAPPAAIPTVLFPGALLGTIEDSDPKYSFALLKGSDNQVKLVAHGQKVDNQPNSAILVAIRSKEITLRLGEQEQTLKVLEDP